MPDRPEPETDQPEAQAEAERRRERAVEDGDRARRAAEQDMLGERPMDRDGVARHVAGAIDQARHQTSAPPPKEKNDRKKLDAAKAIDRPKPIWISFRAPPDVSPKASVRPVMMMTDTTMFLPTGHSMDSRMDCRVASHGLREPDASATAARLHLPQVTEKK